MMSDHALTMQNLSHCTTKPINLYTVYFSSHATVNLIFDEVKTITRAKVFIGGLSQNFFLYRPMNSDLNQTKK